MRSPRPGQGRGGDHQNGNGKRRDSKRSSNATSPVPQARRRCDHEHRFGDLRLFAPPACARCRAVAAYIHAVELAADHPDVDEARALARHARSRLELLGATP